MTAQFLDVITTAAILFAVSAGLLIVFGVMKIINFAHGGFLTIGGYSALLVTTLGLNPWWAIPFAFVIGFFCGMIVERLVMRPLYARPLDAILATWGLGIASAAAFLITLVTGVLLMFYYKPYPDVAYISIKDIHFVVPTGRFMRNIHRWGAHLMVIAVILHMARVFFTASYKKPRKMNWVFGIVLLILTLALSFSGYLLPWDQLAYWAVTIGANIAQSPREITDAAGITRYIDIGGFQKTLLLGSRSVGEDALIRFYVLHVVFLPLLLAVFMGLHFWRLRKDGGLSPGQLAWVLSEVTIGDDARIPGGVSVEELRAYLVDLIARLSRRAFPRP